MIYKVYDKLHKINVSAISMGEVISISGKIGDERVHGIYSEAMFKELQLKIKRIIGGKS